MIDGVVIGLDIGTVRTGVARMHSLVGLPAPLEVLSMGDTFIDQVVELVRREAAAVVVVGLPRSLKGSDTQQTEFVRAMVDEIKQALDVPVVLVDEALTSEKAETELKARRKPYVKGDVDMLAACYILEDYHNFGKVA